MFLYAFDYAFFFGETYTGFVYKDILIDPTKLPINLRRDIFI